MNLKKRQILQTKFTTDEFFQYTEYFTYFGRINYSEDYIRYFKDSVHGGGCIELNFKNYDPIDEDFQIFYYFIQTSKLEEFKEKFPPYKSHEVIINVKNKEEKEKAKAKRPAKKAEKISGPKKTDKDITEEKTEKPAKTISVMTSWIVLSSAAE